MEKQRKKKPVRKGPKAPSLSKEERQHRRKKSRRTFLLVLAVLSLMGAFIAFGIVSTRDTASDSLFKQLDKATAQGIPYLVAVHEDASPAGSASNGKVEDILSTAEKSIRVFDVRYDKEDPDKTALYFISAYHIETLPSLVLVDAKGEVVKTFTLTLDKKVILDEIAKVMSEYESRK